MIQQFIKQFEGLCLEAAKCPAGVWTIGYGHTGNVLPGQKITAEEADRLLEADLRPIVAALPQGLTPNQRIALASLAFNIGLGAFGRSTLLRLVKSNPWNRRIEQEFMRWVYAGGKRLKGLENRRREEARIYFTR